VSLDLLIRNAMLVTPTGQQQSDIAIADGRFAVIAPAGTLDASPEQTVDAAGLLALPGLIDEHVHFRQPGLEHEEDWQSGSLAAVMGGVTTVLEMPNTAPPTASVAAARSKLEIADAGAWCDFGIFGLPAESEEQTRRLAESGLIVGLKVFLGPTTGGLPAPSDDRLLAVLGMAREVGLRVGFHAEDAAIVTEREAVLRSAGRNDPLAHLDARPVEAEVAAIERIGRLLLESGARGHVFHLTSADGLAAVERERATGVDLTCEVTPHHLLLDLSAYEAAGGLARVNPPLRGEPHASALLAALADGRIDCLGSDHAPHLAQDKRRASIWEVPSGFAGVETLLPLMLTAVAGGRLSLERLASATSERPAAAWGLAPAKGSVHVGADADLVLVDPTLAGTIRADALHGKNNLSPFEGRATVGGPVATIVRGRIAMRAGLPAGAPGWGRAAVHEIRSEH